VRVLMVAEHFQPAAELADALGRLDQDVAVHMGARGAENFGSNLVEVCRTHRPDLIHAHSRAAGLAASLVAHDLGLPVVQTFHAYGHNRRVDRYTGAHAAMILAACADDVRELCRLGIQRSRVSVVADGVDTATFTPEGPVAATGKRPRILSVGTSLTRHGHDLVIAAMTRLPKAELVIAGGPDPAQLNGDAEAQRLRRVAEHYGVSGQVRLLGHVRHRRMPALLRSATVVVCDPWHAPAGRVSLEAMACGVPVVAAEIGGLRDIVVDHVTGRHVRPRDPLALAEVLQALLPDAVLRGAYGAAGRDRAEARYSWDQIASDTLRVYRQVVPVETSDQLDQAIPRQKAGRTTAV
jgi:D-inositol-3-phosphate glycosyltransferase